MELFRLPSIPIRLGHEPRQFAEHVRKFREPSQSALPVADLSRSNLRLRQVIEDEPIPVETGRRLCRRIEVLRINQDVVGEVEIAEQRNAPAERRPEHEPIVGLRLHDVPNANELRMARKPFQLGPDIVRLEIDPPDDAGDKGIRVGQIEQPPVSPERLPCLHSHARRRCPA